MDPRIPILVFAVILSACGGNSPTAPSPPPVVVAPPPVVVVPVVAFPPTDPRFDLAFYRQFVHNSFDAPSNMRLLNRQATAPRIYLRTVDDTNAPVDAATVDAAFNAIRSVAPLLNDGMGLASIERGTEARLGQPGWITIVWMNEVLPEVCGSAFSGFIRLYQNNPRCGCNGLTMAPKVIKHELGHALGFWHTDGDSDLMRGTWSCDREPSAREIYHASVAYNQPIGSPAP